MTVSPHLIDSTGKLTFGPPETPEEQQKAANSEAVVRQNGVMVGVYVDNEAGEGPLGSKEQLANRDAIARQFVEAGVGLVVVGLYPSEDGHKIEGCICCLEWYPYGNGGYSCPPKRQEGYILQWNFGWGNPPKPPTRWQRMRLLTRVRLFRVKPRLILLY